MRTVQKIIPSVREDIGDLKTYRAMPTRSLEMIDPFLFLNHHGPQIYRQRNSGLPFAPHPHRGFETVTFILEGDIAHRDSGGHESVIHAGGVQWMTAGRGLIHEEISSREFKENGGPLEILQLWVNLPAKLKMTEPRYKGLERKDIPVISHQGYQRELISGEAEGQRGPFESITGISASILTLEAESEMTLTISQKENIFFYVIRGELDVNGSEVREFQTVLFKNDHEQICIKAKTGSKILLTHGTPINEPVVSYGPFVMNTAEEINDAIKDYQAGKFG